MSALLARAVGTAVAADAQRCMTPLGLGMAPGLADTAPAGDDHLRWRVAGLGAFTEGARLLATPPLAPGIFASPAAVSASLDLRLAPWRRLMLPGWAEGVAGTGVPVTRPCIIN